MKLLAQTLQKGQILRGSDRSAMRRRAGTLLEIPAQSGPVTIPNPSG